MADDFLSLTSAPWTMVLTFAAGYAGYFVAHVGLRDHHQALDQLFRVLLYGFWGLFTYVALRTYFGFDILSASAVGFAISAALGGAWRRWGGRFLTFALRKGRISHSDDLPTAWSAISEVGSAVQMSQIGVILVDGVQLFCDDLARFEHHPNGPCNLGGAGDVMLYVTSIGRRNADGVMVFTDQPEVVDAGGYSKMTYVPREQIARITLRRKKVG